MDLKKGIIGMNINDLDSTILATGVFATVLEWLTTHTDVVAIWVGTIILPATLRVWSFIQQRKEKEFNRKMAQEIHNLEIEARKQEMQQNQDLHNKKINKK